MENLKKKKWVIRASQADKDAIENIAISLGCSLTLATLIYNRGYKDKDSALAFVQKSQEILHDPFLLNDMSLAVNTIISAIKSGDKITIYGDYDVDGVTSVSILYLYLKGKGANVNYYIPSRMTDGYGVSRGAIEKLKEDGTRLIITVDTGVTAIEEIEYARALGLNVVVTDHHECAESLPAGIAVINPKRKDTTYPFPALAGVGVVFKLLCAIEKVYAGCTLTDATRKIAYEYSDLTAIGTIADVMPVVDENRIITALGLQRVENTNRVGLNALVQYCRSGEGKAQKTTRAKKISSGFVGFTLAPRINAAGRLYTADTSVELFLAEKENDAEKLAEQLCEINRERQSQENSIAESAFLQVEENGYIGKSIMVLDSTHWHHGVVGIVSSRVSDRFGVPSILISFEGNSDPYDPEAIGKGSGRSVGGMNLVNALNSCADLLEKYGGHELAAGLSIKRKNLQEFKQRIEKYAEECFKEQPPEHHLEIDCELEFNKLSTELVKEISVLEPYGVSNPTPVFYSNSLLITGITPVGMNRHLKLTLENGKRRITAMLFSTTPQEFPYTYGDEVDIAYNLEINEFNGTETVQINLKDIRLSQRTLDYENDCEEQYKLIRSGESNLDSDYILPSRSKFEAVYKHLQGYARMGRDEYRYSKLVADLTLNNIEINYFQLKTIIKVFIELNIISIEELDDFSFSFKFLSSKNKTNLDKSNILKKLKYTYAKR